MVSEENIMLTVMVVWTFFFMVYILLASKRVPQPKVVRISQNRQSFPRTK